MRLTTFESAQAALEARQLANDPAGVSYAGPGIAVRRRPGSEWEESGQWHLSRGAVVLVDIGFTAQSDRRSLRPCIHVSDPASETQRGFPLIAVVPGTATPSEVGLYPAVAPGSSGLDRTSYALIDHLRCVDKGSVMRIFGEIDADELRAIDSAVVRFLGLPRDERFE